MSAFSLKAAIVIGAQLCAALAITAVYLLWSNTLTHNGRWYVSKAHLEQRVMCGVTYRKRDKPWRGGI